MAILHIHNQSPVNGAALDTCLRLAKRDSGILLIEDAVYAALRDSQVAPNITEHLLNVSFYVLINDALARGLGKDALVPEFACVDYSGFVQLCTEYDRTLSWL